MSDIIVVKRDGTEKPYDSDKIFQAVCKAIKEVEGNLDNKWLAENVVKGVNSYMEKYSVECITVEEIQDLVENLLIYPGNFPEIARAYIRYRYLRELARNNYKGLMDTIGEKLSAANVQNQNANVDEYSFGGRMGEMNSAVARRYALDYIVSPMARENHEGNMIYIHDLDAYAVGSHNCLTIPFDDLLAKGFNTRQTDVRPAQSVSTAFQLVAVIFQLQSLQQFGGVSASHIDWTMVPYVRKSFAKHFLDAMEFVYDTPMGLRPQFEGMDLGQVSIVPDRDFKIRHYYKQNPKAYDYAMKMTEREIYQAVEAMYHNLNTLQSRSGNQLPFTSINYGTCTLPEGRMVTKALLDVSIKGIGALHKTSVFPCGIFQCMKGVNREPGDPNYDLFRLALRSTAQRLYPNYVNVDWSNNIGYDKNDPCTYMSTMGCRTSNGFDINGLGFQKDGRGNICPVTIIMPTLAMMAKEAAEYPATVGCDIYIDPVETFMFYLDKKIHEAKDMLIERFDWICSQSPKSAKFMYENGVMAGYVPEEGIRSALKHGTIVIGQLGLAETLQILIGCDHTEERGMALAKRIEELFNKRCAEFKQEYRLNFGVYYTPAENLCHTAMKKFKEKYGEISNVSDREFFTNSIHVPVWKEMSVFDKIDIESQLTGYSNAGCITYIELDSTVKNNIDALEIIVNYAMDKDIPYLGLNLPNDTCLSCGYCDELNDTCTVCGGTNIQRLRRVTGYLTGDYKTAFNKGKIQETEMRVKHMGVKQ